MLPEHQELPEPLGKGTRSCPNCHTCDIDRLLFIALIAWSGWAMKVTGQ